MNFNWHHVYKELRALAPVWGFGALGILGFALSGTLDMENERRVFYFVASFGVYAAISFVLGAMCFGSEFDQGTLQRLLSEPAHRLQTWWEKTLSLYILLGALHLVFCAGLLILKSHMQGDFALVSHLVLGWMIVLYAGIGGPFFSLLLSQTHLAVWVSMGAPLFFIIVPQLIDHIFDNVMGISFLGDLTRHWTALAVVLTLPWCILGYPLARRRFVEFEIASSDRRGKNSTAFDAIGLSQGPSAARPGSIFNNRWVAVVGKELQLQRTTLSLAFFLLVVWLVDIGLALGPKRPGDGEIWAILSFGVFRPCIFFFLPISIGACAVALERENGVVGWQHSLPFSRRTQWAIKVSVCLAITGVFSWAIGVNLDRVLFSSLEPIGGRHIEPATHWFGILALGATIAGLYASSLARSTLPALVGGIVLCALTFYAVGLGVELGWALQLPRAVLPWLPWVAHVPVGIALILIYSSGFRNYADLHLDRRRIPLQIGVWFLMAYSLACWVEVHRSAIWSI